jgi:hypothetical protein
MICSLVKECIIRQLLDTCFFKDEDIVHAFREKGLFDVSNSTSLW